MNLSEHFTLAEFTASQTAARKGLSNQPDAKALANLKVTASKMEGVRRALGNRVITVSSAYRAPAVNAAVGGAKNSAHVQGWAVDFNCHGFGSPLEVAKALQNSGIAYDQIIHEFRSWVHISFDPKGRQMELTIDGNGTRQGLHP